MVLWLPLGAEQEQSYAQLVPIRRTATSDALPVKLAVTPLLVPLNVFSAHQRSILD